MEKHEKPPINQSIIKSKIEMIDSCEIKILSGNEILFAMQKLYEIYRDEYNWMPPDNNPSGYKVKNGLLYDKYDSSDFVIYYGAFYQGNLVASLRVLNGELDIFNYPTHVIKKEKY